MTDETNETGRDATGVPEGAEAPTGAEEFAHSDPVRGGRPTAPAKPVAPTVPIETADEPADDALAPEEPVLTLDEQPDEPPEAPADGTPVETTSEPAAPRPPRSPVVMALAVATAVLFVTTVLFGLMAFAPRLSPIKSGPAKLAVQAQEADDLEALAKRFAANFVSLDYKTIDADLDRMTADATSTFGAQLRKTIDTIGSEFKKRKASSSGRALDAAVLSHTEDSAIVQVLLRRTKKNVGTEGPETGNQVVNVTLVKTPGGWKVENLTQLGAENQ